MSKQPQCLSFPDHFIPHHIVYHPRRRYVSFFVRPDGIVEIRAPRGATPAKLQQLLLEQQHRLPKPPKPPQSALKNSVHYRGLLYDVVLRPLAARAKPFFAIQEDGCIALHTATPERAAEQLEHCLIEECVNVFRERTAHFCRQLNVGVRHISIRDLKSRWGSCSPASASLRYNWRLIMAPPNILDYIVIHELAHLHVPNHSRAFWQLVAEHDPACREHRKWLRLNGNRLFLPLDIS